MKFCPICGRPLQDGDICGCQDAADTSAVNAADLSRFEDAQPTPQSAAQPQPTEPAEQQPQPEAPDAQPVSVQPEQPAQPEQKADEEVFRQFAQPAPQEPQPGAPYPQYRTYAPPKPKDDKFTKALKSLPIAFKSYFKDSEKVISIAKDTKDIVLPLMYIAILFVADLLLSIVFFARMTSTTYWIGLGNLASVFGSVNRFNIGFVLLTAVIMTVFVCVVYTVSRFAAQMIFAKKTPEEALTGALTEFGFHAIIVACLVLAAAVFGLITAWLVVPLLGLAAAYLVVQYVTASLKDAEGYENKFVRGVILAATVMIGIALVFWRLTLVCSMNYSYRSLSYSYGNLYSGLEGILNSYY